MTDENQTYKIRMVGDLREFYSWHFKYEGDNSLHPHDKDGALPIVITLTARDGRHIPGVYTNEHGDTITIAEAYRYADAMLAARDANE